MGNPSAILVTPAGPIKAASLDVGLDAAEHLDLHVLWPDGWREQLLAREAYLAGGDAHRAMLLKAALESDAERILMARGGYGCIRTLAAAQAAGIALFDGTVTPLWGFSDGTALLGAWMKAGWPAWLAPPLTQLARLEPLSQARFRASWHAGQVPSFEGLRTLRQGSVTAPLAGGNLCVLVSCLKTPFEVPLAGHILVLEDTGERAYKVDRLMTQLLLSGALDEIVGLVIGQFSHVPQDQQTETKRFFERFAQDLNIPVVADLPVGHDVLNAPLPIGRATGFLATLSAELNGEGALTFTEVA